MTAHRLYDAESLKLYDRDDSDAWTGEDEESVSPLSQEPAAGSPEVVEQTAERLYASGSVFFRPGQEDVLTKRRASTGKEVHYFIGPIRDSMSEAEQDRDRWAATASWKVEEEDWKRREGELLAEVERLKGENGRFRQDLVEQAASWHGKELEALRQRDALAEQLAERVRRHESDARDLEQLSVTVRDESRRAHEAELQADALASALLGLRQFLGVFLCHDGDGRWRTARDINPGDSVSGEAIKVAEAALKLAGRLP